MVKATIFPLDTLSRDEESQIIAGKIRQLASKCFTEVEIPVNWYLFQIAIEEMKVNGKMVIPFETFVDIGKLRNMSKNQTTAALQYLHDLNVCLYYPLILPDSCIHVTPVPVRCNIEVNGCFIWRKRTLHTQQSDSEKTEE